MKKFFEKYIYKSQKLLNLDVKYFLSASSYSSIQQIVGIISGLSISYFFGHFATKRLFGDYNYILAIIGFLTITTLPGIDNYLIRSLGHKYNSSYLQSFKYKIIFSIIGVFILLGFAIYYFPTNPPFGFTLVLIALLFPFLEPFQLFNEFFIATKRFKEISFFLSLSSILAVLFIGFSVLFTQSLLLVVFSYILSILIPSFLAFLYSLRFIDRTKKIDKDLFKMGLFMTVISAIPWTTAYLGQIILASLLGSELLAIFVVAHKIPLYIHKNLFVFHKPLTAKLASQTNKEHLETIKKHSLKLLLWGLLLSLLVYLISPFVIDIIFTDKYTEAIPIAQLLSFSIIPLPLTWLIEDIIVFQKIKKPQLYSNLLMNSLKIILYFVLIPFFKVYGIVLVYLFDRYSTLAIDLIIIKKYSKA